MDKEPGSAAPSADGRPSLVVKSVWPWSSEALRQTATGADAGSEAHPRRARGRREFFGVGPASHSSVNSTASYSCRPVCVHPTAKEQALPCQLVLPSLLCGCLIWALTVTSNKIHSSVCIAVRFYFPYIISVHHVSALCPERSEEDVSSPGTRVTGSSKPPCMCWELNLGPLREQCS